MRSEHWYGDDGAELVVTCADGSCLGELLVATAGGPEASVEILLQPRDEFGRPLGTPFVVHREQVPLLPLVDSSRRVGRFWLPDGLKEETVRDCFFRITPDGRRH